MIFGSATAFQPTSPRGGRRAGHHAGGRTQDFNPRPHAGDDQRLWRGLPREGYFNPRPHAGDDFLQPRAFSQPLHFNPRPHAGDDSRRFNDELGRLWISTHVPMRGTTVFAKRPALAVQISTHVPMRGTTVMLSFRVDGETFQPTSPCGGRRRKGARNTFYRKDFNPRPHAGDDFFPSSRLM